MERESPGKVEISSRVVIRATGLGKKYTLAHRRAPNVGLRHILQNSIQAPFRSLLGKPPQAREDGTKEDFWALRDLAFEVEKGQVTGIIGRNGAGKSTLLKIMSRITEPSTGRIEIDGRVASLLEVGTGFQPELTGRENIFLNGAILGMARSEILRKFDEIVRFAEVEKFLDTPVKFYSSGMYVRLAFAVAAHLDPEILIVDEVLAVGDTAFQQKCLDRMLSISKSGSTVFFVSHNLSTVKQLCSHGMLLDKGQIAFQGSAVDTIARYMESRNSVGERWERRLAIPPEGSGLYFRAASILNSTGNVSADLRNDETFCLEVDFEATAFFDNALISVQFKNQEGLVVFTSCNTDLTQRFVPFEVGRQTYRAHYDAINLFPGRYTLNISAHIPQGPLLDLIDDEVSFVVHDVGGHANLFKDGRVGTMCPVLIWERV
jgi:lipopolysaccharide transport system ATP-binding protein